MNPARPRHCDGLGATRAGKAPSRKPLEPEGSGKARESRPKSVDLHARIPGTLRGEEMRVFLLVSMAF